VSTDKATTTLLSGSTVDLAERLGTSNTAAYTSAIACDRPGLTPDSDGRGGTFRVPATPVPVTCTITNTAPATVPTVTKTLTSSTFEADGSWTSVYAVTVSSTPTAPPTQYTLTDTLAFGGGITINSATVTGPPDESVNPAWDGRTDTVVVARGTLETGQTDEFTVTVNATITQDATASDVSCGEGGGFLNQAEVSLAPVAPSARFARADPASTSSQDSACADGVLPEQGGGASGGGAAGGAPALAFTGAAISALAATALALIALGLLLWSVGRRPTSGRPE
jgi:hypothetical protein